MPAAPRSGAARSSYPEQPSENLVQFERAHPEIQAVRIAGTLVVPLQMPKQYFLVVRFFSGFRQFDRRLVRPVAGRTGRSERRSSVSTGPHCHKECMSAEPRDEEELRTGRVSLAQVDTGRLNATDHLASCGNDSVGADDADAMIFLMVTYRYTVARHTFRRPGRTLQHRGIAALHHADRWQRSSVQLGLTGQGPQRTGIQYTVGQPCGR